MQVNITNLGSGKLSLDVTVGEVTVRENFDIGETIDVGDKITVDELNQSPEIQALVAAGTISVASQAEAVDVAESIKLMQSVILGAPILADVDRIVTTIDIAAIAQTIAAQPDVPRNLTCTLTDGDDSVTATITYIGVDPAGRAVTEIQNIALGTGKAFVGTKIFASVTSITVSGLSGEAGGDAIVVGVGDVIGLPSDIVATTAVKHTYLGGVLVTPDAIAVGASLSGVDANGGTYDGSKLMHVFYNTGE